MEDSHPMGEDFARWVELTDDYGSRIAHAWEEDNSDRSDLAELAKRARQLSEMAELWNPGTAAHR
ncbi:hypothetical protein ACFPPF_08400 [Xenophilus aerolatus]|nr:hypothetical protein [Xenophilus aerolatus]